MTTSTIPPAKTPNSRLHFITKTAVMFADVAIHVVRCLMDSCENNAASRFPTAHHNLMENIFITRFFPNNRYRRMVLQAIVFNTDHKKYCSICIIS
jgi:hypothetical protein